MCLALYISSRSKLPLIEWDKKQPAFYAKILNTHDQVVKKQFQYPNVIYLGSSEGCGCGFILDGADPEKLPIIKNDREKLIVYIKLALQVDPDLQMLGCWEGDQGKKPTRIIQLSLSQLTTFDFEMNEIIFVEHITNDV